MGMAESSYSIRGCQIGDKELEIIRDLIRGKEVLGWTAISRLVRERWHWRQSNGRLKDRTCRDMLLALENVEISRSVAIGWTDGWMLMIQIHSLKCQIVG